VDVSSLSRPGRLAAAGLAAAATLLVVGGARAGDPAELQAQADRLLATDASIEAQERGALLELYGLESRLAASERRLAALRVRLAALEREQADARRRLGIARRTLVTAERRLESRLRALYYEDEVDPLAVILGAASLDDAITALDELTRAAGQDREIVGEVSASRTTVRAAIDGLAKRRGELTAAVAEAQAARDALAAARDERAAYVDRLVRRREATRREVAALGAQADAAAEKAQEVTESAEPATSPPPILPLPTVGPGATITVQATGYALPGTTATGIPVGWGVAAVDPNVIPLGTRMTVPGYGEAVAADTGPAVVGAAIDLWFPTVAEALAWGRRTVAITLH
jgi:3D (Asp-Asp-Asp) domain-containing protein/peptidoglycan hydrolase CwlO-like protein